MHARTSLLETVPYTNHDPLAAPLGPFRSSPVSCDPRAREDLFVGRKDELAALEADAERVRSGIPRIVLIEGPPGIGKTALVRGFLARATDFRAFAASGDEVEADLAYGVVEQFARASRTDLPEPLTRLFPGSLPPADPVAVGAGIIDLLGILQDAGPVALVVDDAHWGDIPSLQALLFALRRLQADRVMAIVLVRDEDSSRLPEGLHRLAASERGSRLRIGGLEAADLGRLAAALGAGPLSRSGAERLHRHTAGNPLHARALLDELSAEALRQPGLLLPCPRSFRLTVLRRLAGCPDGARRLVVAAAVLGMRCPLGLAADLAQIEDLLGSLQQAIAARLLVMPEGGAVATIAFPHPLVRAAVYHDLGPARRAALHTTAGELVDSEAARIRHRVAAAPGEDPELAAEVAAFAHREAGRGAWSTAAAHLHSAARLCPGRSQRERLTLEAVECLLMSGDIAEAASYAEKIRGFEERPRRGYVLGWLGLCTGSLPVAEKMLVEAWETSDPSLEPQLAVNAALRLGAIGILQSRGTEAVAWTRRALALAAKSGCVALGARLNLGVGLGIAGRATEGLQALALVPEPAGAGPVDFDALLGRGFLRLWTDDPAGARADAAPVVAARHQGPFWLGLAGLHLLAEAEYRLGAWDDAIMHAELGASTASDADHLWLQPFLHASAARPLAARGEWEAAKAHAQRAVALARALGDSASLAHSATAEAAIANARADWAAAVSALGPLQYLTNPDRTYEPAVLPWREMLIEALFRMGRLEEGEAALVPFEALATERGRRSSMAVAARLRGGLEAARGRSEAAEAGYRSALAHADQISIPFDRALIELDFAAFLRRVGRRRAAVTQLEAARERFESLGARPYLARCHRELAACGLTPAKRSHREVGHLTPQERAVGRLVASGLSNREAAAELVVSVKTVEYHLGNAYAKLGVCSRVQLAARLGKE